MKMGQIVTLLPEASSPNQRSLINKALKETNESFGQTLSKAIADVNALQMEAGKAMEQLIAGQATDLHEVMIAAEKAKTSFDLLLEIRNKAIETYREIMRIQV